jgi:quercetin dioxygenase-like cupin family protein
LKGVIVKIIKVIRKPIQHYIRPKSLLPILGLLLLINGLSSWQPILAQENEFAGEKIVHVLEEPRHRTVLQKGQLYMIDMQLNPGDTSFPHRHDQAILLNRISSPDGPQLGIIEAITTYASETFTHKIENNGDHLWRILAFIHDGNGEPVRINDRPSEMNGEPEIENNWFRTYRIELAAGETTFTQRHHNPSVIVQATEGLVQVSREDGITRELAQAGDWAFREAGASYRITNVGNDRVIINVNEIRLQFDKDTNNAR